MSNEHNPFGSGGGYGAQNVAFGEARDAAAAELPAPAAPGDLIKDTSTAGFSRDVIQESRTQPVLVDFWAPWCGPCKQLTPALEKTVREARGRIKLVKMNIDDHPSIPGQLGIQSIPAVIAFVNGNPVDGFMGAIPESQIREFIDRVAGKGGAARPDMTDALKAAEKARAAGDSELATGIYSDILDAIPDNADAIAGLADLLFEAGDRQGAEQTIASAPKELSDSPALAAVRARIALADQAAGLGDPVELERRLAENPKNHQARFDLAMIHNAQGRRSDAAEELLEIIRSDRTWNDDAARAQLLKLFEAWGMADEATLAARRKLSSLLFS